MSEPKFVYVTYIATTPEKLWQALTDGAFTRQFWFGTSVESDWSRGSRVIFRSGGEVHDTGEVLDCVPYRRLSYSWQVEFHEVFRREKPSRVTFELEPTGGPELSSLKSLLETGRPSASTSAEQAHDARERAIALAESNAG